MPGGLHGTRIQPPLAHKAYGETTGDPTLDRLAHNLKKPAADTLNPDLATYFLNGGEGFKGPPSQDASYCDAQVQMVSGSHLGGLPGVTPGIIQPMLLNVQGQKPSLSNKWQGGWITFARDWEQHMHLILA